MSVETRAGSERNHGTAAAPSRTAAAAVNSVVNTSGPKNRFGAGVAGIGCGCGSGTGMKSLLNRGCTPTCHESCLAGIHLTAAGS
jgi:hypothetical protein